MLLEDELFLWFVKLRARKLPLRDTDLQKKALIIAKRILVDPEVSLKDAEKEQYIKFCASSGWVDNFKNRHKIVNRFITTKCTFLKEDIQKALVTYFEELNTLTQSLKPKLFFNMDKTVIFFELSTERTLELKSKKSIGMLSSG